MHKSTFTVPQEHPSFPAHFPGNPIVPGALLMQWIFTMVRSQYSESVIPAIRSMKFLKSLHPGDQCSLELTNDATRCQLTIACYCQSELVCKGIVELIPAEQVQQR